jgi:hypothetical protein
MYNKMSDFLYNDSELQMDSKLILCIEEHDSNRFYDSVDTRLFIGWSNIDQDYYVRGKRQDTDSKEFVPYAFRCEHTDDLYDFIEFVVGQYSCASITLYNYNNIDSILTNDDELTYEFFEENMDRNYEIAAYDEVVLKRSQITKYLRMLKNTYNWERKN